MKVIEQEMLDAINLNINWKKGNTEVRLTSNGCDVFLHDNHIASVNKVGKVTVNLKTLKSWPSLTTKSRLKALSINVTTVKGVTMIDGVDISTL